MARKLAIGNYIFAGGFTLGVEKHFDVLAHLENGRFGTATAQRNWPNLTIETDPKKWADTARRLLAGKRLSLLYCNPPCAAWSRAGASTNRGNSKDAWRKATHHSNHTLLAAELALALQPDVWVWESVAQAWEHGRDFCEVLRQRFAERDYAITILITDLALLGIPQRRRRFHFIAHRSKLPVSIFVKPANELPRLTDFLQMVPGPHTLKPVAESNLRWLCKMHAEGIYGSLQSVADTETPVWPERTASTGTRYKVGRPSFLHRRANPQGLCYTVTGDPKIYHPIELRFLSVEEQAALGGWPREFVFTGNTNTQYAEIAKAVQPRVARYLAEQLAQIDDTAPAKPGSLTVIDHTKQIQTDNEVKNFTL